ncbi:MBL fold metallo-hydrolase [Leptotrichia sp. OH3620_COT-345]|uniref:MBL fold metallo-hydrolase n=1 Tax=Leptotrichia sp. OH3620_COT-345 TaxID=2491048 RepID=UPI000F647653|nr:MBL fold metallo-hydrolase [Leptotrichia sp. OH3620_COT-345]RRD39550.1 MBL fold metallo-hydrolase [Leptotrichia sp. OH3620_COT-345]
MSNIIEEIRYFSCGYCTNEMSRIFKGVPKKKLNFYAGVFLIKHRKYGYVLYDTGYNIRLLKNTIKYMIYKKLNPVTLKREDMIDNHLKKAGIKAEEIKRIILSHLHPDHIGGIEYFSDIEIIITEECFREYDKSSFKSLIFKEFLPKDFEKRLKIINSENRNKNIYGIESYDLFNDGSFLLISINGHSKGQCCAFFPEKNLFIASDVCWGMELLLLTEKMKFLPKMVQDNFSEYKKGVETLKKLAEKGVKIIVSHDPPERIRGVLDE